MKVIIDEKLIHRNKKIGQIASIVSLIVLGIGMYITLFPTEQLGTAADAVTWSFGALVLGFILSQIGIYYGNRWGRSPRPDERITQALKGLDDKYALYHHTSRVPHLLVGPAGIWTILPFQQGGTITYDSKKKQWNQKGGNWYLKFFAQENLGRPDLDVKAHLGDLQKMFESKENIGSMPKFQAVLVFLNEKAVIQATDAPCPTLPADKLKDFIRHRAKETPLPLEIIQQIQAVLPG